MKILRIHIQNLNSLRGEHRIDFTEPPLSDHPLYAIVGPTGAGKTTILDAITLALYGLTERTKEATEASKEVATVMTHGTARCSAEVEFETEQGRFRSVWRRRRAHKKVTNDLMGTEREIGKYNQLTEAYDILATKKREVRELTERVVGLDYDRFVRSVMLTQGDFDRFLKSKPGEKAAILERITGTAIYRDLSEGAFNKHKLAREAYRQGTDQLQHALPLGQDARRELDLQIDDWIGRGLRLATALQQTGQQLQKYRNATVQADHLQRSRTKLLETLHQREALADERELLTQNDRLNPYRPALQENDKIDLEQQENHRVHAINEKQRAELLVRQQRDAEAASVARQKMVDYQNDAAIREDTLSRAEGLEKDITLLLRDREQGASQLALHLRSRQSLEERRGALEALGTALREKLQGHTATSLEEGLRTLEVDLPATEQRVVSLEKGMAYRQLEARMLAEREKESVLLTELADLSDRLKRQRNLVAGCEAAVETQSLRVDNARLRAQVSEHRHNLEPGHPCPLCGSTHHPYLEHGSTETEGELGNLRNELTRLKNDLTRVDNELGKTLGQDQLAKERHAAITGLLTEMNKQLSPTAPEESMEELRGVHQSLILQRGLQQSALNELRGLRTSLPELGRQQVELEAVNEKYHALNVEIDKLRKVIASKELTIGDGRKILAELLGDEATSATLRRRYASGADQLRERLAGLETQGSTAATALTVADERLKLLAERIKMLEARQRVLSDHLSAGLQGLGLSYEKARKLLLPVEKVGPLREKLQMADRDWDAATALLKEAERANEAATALLGELSPETELKAEEVRLSEEITTVQRTVGGLEEQRKEDDLRTALTANLQMQLKMLEGERDRWAAMNELIGSANGKKFRSFAQSITLQRLVDIGNDHLKTISPRYRMQYAPPPPGGKEELELEIVDGYMNDNRRMMNTLSGGETFLVSLALALGLSDLASGKQLIQSLFIDEGFGTLDGKTLDQAMVTLEQLQERGKTIGIISHVQELRERVVCQIRLEPVGDGFSRIELAN